MEKSAEEFIREKSFPNGITNEKWEEHKHNHSGTNWVEFAIKTMEEYNKNELLSFKKWYDNLNPTDKISVWSEDGSQQGLFNLSDEQIIQKWNRYQKPNHNTKFPDNEGIINTVVNH